MTQTETLTMFDHAEAENPIVDHDATLCPVMGENDTDGALTIHGNLLHPHYIVRVAGEPVSVLADLQTGRTAALLEECARLRAALNDPVARIVSALEAVVPRCNDKLVTRNVLKLKRAVYNLRPAGSELLSKVKPHLAADEYEQLVSVNDTVSTLASLERAMSDAYEADLADGGKVLAHLEDADRLFEGLSYVQPSLYEAVSERLGSKENIGAKERRKLEDSLLQYVLRSSTKTSPLSSFCLLHVGRWEESSRPIRKISYSGTIRRRVDVKGALLRAICEPLMRDFARVSGSYPLMLNPSLEKSNGRVRVHTVNEGKLESGRFYGTGEGLMEFNSSPVLECIEHVLRSSGRDGLFVDEICEAVCRLAPKARPEQVRGFLAKLLELQVLQPQGVLIEQQDALEWALGLTSKFDDELGRTTHRILKQIRADLIDFCVAAAPTRARLVERIRGHVAELLALEGANPPRAIEKPNFYENCYLAEVSRNLPTGFLEPYGSELDLLLRMAPLLDYAHVRRCVAADYFLHLSGQAKERNTDLSAAEYLDQFEREYGMGFPIPGKPWPAPMSDITRALLAARRALRDYLEEVITGRADPALDVGVLERIVAMLPEQVARRSVSQSYLAQVVNEEHGEMLVINQVFGGRSALMSRFLEDVDEDELAGVRGYLLRGSDAGAYAEVPGVFGFNANRHPQLADREVSVAPFPPSWPGTGKLDLRSMRVAHDTRRHTLSFLTPEGEEVDLWYQGFLIPPLLPRLQRTLALTFMDGPVNMLLSVVIERSVVSASEPKMLPRVTLGNLVLARKQWTLPRSAIPDASLSGLAFFEGVQQWRERLGLPNECFMRTVPIGESDTQVGEVMNFESLNFKDMKPFYMRCDRPNFVRLMQRSLKRNSHALMVTELLPRLENGFVSVGGRSHVSEIQFELTRPGR